MRELIWYLNLGLELCVLKNAGHWQRCSPKQLHIYSTNGIALVHTVTGSLMHFNRNDSLKPPH